MTNLRNWVILNKTTCLIGIFFAANSAAVSLLPMLLPHFTIMLQCTLPQAALTSTIGTLCAFGFSLAGTTLIERLRPHRALLLGSICAGCILMLYAWMQSLWQLYLTGVCTGAVMALGMNASCASILQAKYGTCSAAPIGVVFGVASAASAGLMFILGRLLARYDWEIILMACGLLLFCVCILCYPPLSHGTYGVKVPIEQKHNTPNPNARANAKRKYMIFLYGLLLASTLFISVSMFLTSYWQAHGMSASSSHAYSSLFTLIGSMVVSLSGVVLQTIGSKRFVVMLFVGYTLGVLCLMTWPSLQAPWFTVLSLLLLCMAKPIRNLPSLIIPAMFAPQEYARWNYVSMTVYYIGSALCTWFMGAFIERTGSYIHAYSLLLVFAAVACVLMHCALRTTTHLQTTQE